ncbi:MAG TPA: transcriptional regulator [Deltaproteobacteria bacterium]|nr:transcriptional regulator [Deltaproteobacteria bacterium]
MGNDIEQTARQRIIALLTDFEMSARELSQAIGIKEKEVVRHLVHVEKTVSPQKKKLVIRPFQCLDCEYLFKERKRYTRPGRCPRCRGTHVETPTFRII